jgi:hypothetical protein
MRKIIFTITCVAAMAAVAAEFPLVSLIFEYTVTADGSRQNIRIVKIEQPVTHKDLSSALTQTEKLRGIRKVSKRPRLKAKEAGHKLYEVAVFDLRNRKYVTDE